LRDNRKRPKYIDSSVRNAVKFIVEPRVVERDQPSVSISSESKIAPDKEGAKQILTSGAPQHPNEPIDSRSAIPYAVDSTLSILIRDGLREAAKDRLIERIRMSLQKASYVQCVGLDKLIPLEGIYQQVRVRSSLYRDASPPLVPLSLVDQGSNAVVLGGPGSGKTIFLHWAFLSLLNRQNTIPVLFTLRLPGAIEALRSFIDDLGTERAFRKRRTTIVLLVDGYDEVDSESRKKVSELLGKFDSLGLGPFYTTCRLYYTIIDLNAPYYYIEPFGDAQAEAFVAAFFRACGIEHDAKDLVKELRAKGFGDFLASPLMLTLVCILKTGPLPQLPRSSIGLIRRALETLTFRWDEKRGIARTGEIPVDGEERIRCLMRIAYNFVGPIGSESAVLRYAQQHLKFIQRTDISPAKFLTEIAQWYGILVPTSDDQWEFVHRTLYDFLAARFWVESGSFSADAITKWDTRTAYAACLMPDATRCLVKALHSTRELHVLTECLSNNAPFDPDEVARAVVRHYGFEHSIRAFLHRRTDDEICVEVKQDFFHLVSNEFLDSLASVGNRNFSKVHDLILALALSELMRRGRKFDLKLREDVVSLSFRVTRTGTEFGPFRIRDLQPAKSDSGRMLKFVHSTVGNDSPNIPGRKHLRETGTGRKRDSK